jgi:hypothetical protein
MDKAPDKIELLVRLARGQLSEDQRNQVEAELKDKPELAEAYELICRLYAESQELDWPRLSQGIKEISRQLYDDFLKSRTRPGKKSGVKVFDSGVLPAPDGVRPAAVDTRRIKYCFEDYSLEISLYPISPESYELIGHVIGAPEGTVITVNLKSRRAQQREHTDRFQLFRFERVAAGPYELVLAQGRRPIGMVNLEL